MTITWTYIAMSTSRWAAPSTPVATAVESAPRTRMWRGGSPRPSPRRDRSRARRGRPRRMPREARRSRAGLAAGRPRSVIGSPRRSAAGVDASRRRRVEVGAIPSTPATDDSGGTLPSMSDHASGARCRPLRGVWVTAVERRREEAQAGDHHGTTAGITEGDDAPRRRGHAATAASGPSRRRCRREVPVVPPGAATGPEGAISRPSRVDAGDVATVARSSCDRTRPRRGCSSRSTERETSSSGAATRPEQPAARPT